MKTFTYPINIQQDEDGVYIATLEDFAGVFQGVTEGNSFEEVLANAVELLDAAIAYAMDFNGNIPLPSKCKKGNHAVAVSTLTMAKLLLYWEMKEQGLKKADIARRLDCSAKTVDRIFDISHKSRIDQIDAAAMALGKHMVLSME